MLAWAILGVAACDATIDPTDPADAIAVEGEPADDEGDDADPEDEADELEPPVWGEPLPLVTAEAWASGRMEDDPLAHERPATVECPAAAWGPEAGGLEVQTGTCNYLFVAQPSLAAIEADDAIDLVVFHQELDAAEPAEGHVAILLGDAVIWEAHVEIPTHANVLEARIVAERAWPVGTTVGVHLHNHGYNSWTVLDVSTAPRSHPRTQP
jgi:hypothetical protein